MRGGAPRVACWQRASEAAPAGVASEGAVEIMAAVLRVAQAGAGGSDEVSGSRCGACVPKLSSGWPEAVEDGAAFKNSEVAPV